MADNYYIPGDSDPDEDVETVFDAMDAWERNRAAHQAAEDKQAHDDALSTMFRDGLRIRKLDTYDPKAWDPSLVPEEVRGSWPKGLTHADH